MKVFAFYNILLYCKTSFINTHVDYASYSECNNISVTFNKTYTTMYAYDRK